MLVRMVMRKGQLFRASKLIYPEIGPSAEALAPLVALAWVDDDGVLSLEQLFQMLRKDEIVACFSTALTRPRAAKPDLFEQLVPLYPEPRRLSEWYPGFAEAVYEWRLQALCDRLRLLFFGNLHQDWSEFVLADLGVLRYEQVAFSIDSRAMRQREDVEVALALHECAEQLAAGAAVEQVLARAEHLRSANPWLERRRARLLFHLGQHCEREGNWALAQQVYPLSAHPQAPLRHIRVLERGEQWAAALHLAEAVSEQPLNALQAQALARVLPRLRRKLGGLCSRGARHPDG
ncbi:VRR-NUC domain-containing protein, partial [Pseudomonas laurentiana]|nr:VRR-NUC domain-containing protein [Pseudomonas laurentiana]